MVDHVRDGQVVLNLHVDFALPRQEPMLWIADAVAGAANAAQDGNREWIDVLANLGEQIEIKIR